MPVETSIFSHDLVLLNTVDARQLIGLPEGYASDLAIDVFHEDEQDAILSDLTAAFPWPVRCITRQQSEGVYANHLNRISTFGAIAFIPAVLAICILAAVNIRKSMGRQPDLGIMKAMGWTTGNIVRLHLYRTLYVCLPAAVVGMGLAFFLVYGSGAVWPGKLLFGWEGDPPYLYLDPKGAVTVLLEVTGFILAPVVASALAPAIKSATQDVHNLIEGAGSR
jgi:ABC-type lipoprotein release transport system permease subunit